MSAIATPAFFQKPTICSVKTVSRNTVRVSECLLQATVKMIVFKRIKTVVLVSFHDWLS